MVVNKNSSDGNKIIVRGSDTYTFDDEQHIHKLNGKNLKGVTSLIDKTLAKPALLPWAVKETVTWIEGNCPFDGQVYAVTKEDLINAKRAHTVRKTNAGDWGTRVHKACELWATTGEITQDEDIYPSVRNFIEFITINGFEVLDVERNVWSKEWWIGGIFDLVLRKDGKVYIADIKTSSGIYDTHLIQMGAYYKCLQELGLISDYGVDEFNGAIVINLLKPKSVKELAGEHKIQHCTTTALPTMVSLYEDIVSIEKNRSVLDTITKAIIRGVTF